MKLLKLLKSLIAKGFATAEEKAEVKALYKELEIADAEAAEVVKDDVKAATELPENDPKENEDELEKNIKALVSKAVKASTAEEVVKAVDGIKSEVKAWFDSQKEAIKTKSGNYHPDVVEKRKGLNAYMRSFMRALTENNVNELMKLNKVASTKELTTDQTGTPFGGYAVDRELSAEITALVTDYGVARREMMAVPLSRNSYAANELATDVTVSWVDEGAVLGSTQIVMGQESLTLKKLGAIVTLTRELLEDSEIDLFAFIASRVAEGFAQFEDKAFFMGAGSDDTANAKFTGVLNYAGANKVTMTGDAFADMTADNLLDMQDKSPQSVVANGKYYMHRSIRNLVRKLKGDDGQYIYQDVSGNGPATIWGKPVVEVEVMPSIADSADETPFVAFGDLKKSSIFGYKGTIAADRFNAGTIKNVAGDGDINLITTDRQAVRWIERVGAVAMIESAVTVLKTAKTV